MTGAAPARSAPGYRLFVRTYGCQMNVHDSQRIIDLMIPLGFRVTGDPDDADLVVYNTCHIRENAAGKIYSELGRARQRKAARAAAGKRTVIAIAGCVAQAEGAEIVRRAPCVDIVIGPQNYHRLPGAAARALAPGGGRSIEIDFPAESRFDFLPEESHARGPVAHVAIQEGCDRFCTFCVVPYTRGAEYARPAAGILDEIRRRLDGGAREIVLLGQNVNAWRDGDGRGLGDLLHEAGKLPGLVRMRYTTSHPLAVDERLIRAHAEEAHLMPFLHLPVQSGSDRILRLMNRRHTAAHYLDVVARLRRARPDLALASDFIVGFPGETEQDFSETLALADAAGFSQGYAFSFSARPGTPAATLPDQVPEPVRRERLLRLQERLGASRLAFNRTCTGLDMPVLFEKPGAKPGQWVGRSPWMQAVHVMSPSDPAGSVRRVTIRTAGPNSLGGTLAGESG